MSRRARLLHRLVRQHYRHGGLTKRRRRELRIIRETELLLLGLRADFGFGRRFHTTTLMGFVKKQLKRAMSSTLAGGPTVAIDAMLGTLKAQGVIKDGDWFWDTDGAVKMRVLLRTKPVEHIHLTVRV